MRNPLTDPRHGDILITPRRGERQVRERTENTVCYLSIKRSVLKGPYKQTGYCSIPQWRAWCRDQKAKVIQRGESAFLIIERPNQCAAHHAEMNTTETASGSAASATEKI